MAMYRLINTIQEAKYVTRESLDDVAYWCHGESDPVGGLVKCGNKIAMIGMWIIREDIGTYRVMSDALFAETYELADIGADTHVGGLYR
jgi:hypothetical protein